MNQWPMNKLGV